MAFLSDTDRGLTVVKDHYSHLGPGYYQQQSKNKPQARVPFSSQSKRVSIFNDPNKIQPGPGDYDIAHEIVDSQIQAYMNKSTVIVKVQANGTSSFKSGQPRFKRVKNKIPGPGQYDCKSASSSVKQKVTSHIKSNQNTQYRCLSTHHTTPGIPYDQKHLTGQQLQDIEDLQQNIQKHKLEDKNVGPGDYEKETQKKAIGSLSWAKSKTKRFEDQNQNQIGPGQYSIELRQQVKKNPSPSFCSETVRTYFDNIIYQTNSELKAELRKKTGFKDQTLPGPGYYLTEKHLQAIKTTTPSQSFNFGCNINRFQESQEVNQIGPGEYNNIQSGIGQQKRVKNFINQSFQSTQERDTGFGNSNRNPGPGNYSSQEKTLKMDVIKKFTLGYKGSFGTTTKRFQESQDQSTQQQSQNIYDQVTTNSDQKKISSVFKSSTKREVFQSTKSPAIGSYNLNSFDISTKAEKEQLYIKNLEKIEMFKPGFNSNVPRFTIGQTEPVRSYTVDNFDISKTNKEKSGARVCFTSKAKRIEFYKPIESPSVGVYKTQSSWLRPSFNINYNQLI